MVLWGTIVNTIAIIVGVLIGRLIPKINEGVRTTVMQALALGVCVLGIMMAMKTANFIILLFSLVVGGVVGELLRIQHHLDWVGGRLEKVLGNKGNGNISTGFVTATLVYCVGAMAILGALDSGLRNNHDILYTKSMLDGFSAIIFSSTLGIGVLFAAVPVFLYQGIIALSSTYITHFINQAMLDAIIIEVTAVGGILILGIGLNILEIKKFQVANLLPAIVIAAIAVFVSIEVTPLLARLFQ
jgi:uncharacterized membrane protein YqgA involved in biofilm formation